MQTQNKSIVQINPADSLPVELSISFSPERTSQLANDSEFVSEYQLVAGENMFITKTDNKLVFSSTDTQTGDPGPQGPPGPAPQHQWMGTQLIWELPSGGWGAPVDLIGATGLTGANGYDGATYIPIVTQTVDDALTLSWLSNDKNAPIVPPTTVALPRGPQGIQGVQGKQGTTNYSDLINRPYINGVEVVGNLVASQLHLISEDDLRDTEARMAELTRDIFSLESRVAALESKI